MNKNQEYWANPDGHNVPNLYEPDTAGKKELLLGVMNRYVGKNDSILEIGCNVGRNLNVLQNDGYEKLSGLEINTVAVEMGKGFYPDLKAKVYVGAVEDLVTTLPNFDVIFSLAVFEHIHFLSDWVFPEIQKRAKKFLITIEDEKNATWKHFPRNYKKVFDTLEQLEETPPMSGGELDGFVVRVFKV